MYARNYFPPFDFFNEPTAANENPMEKESVKEEGAQNGIELNGAFNG